MLIFTLRLPQESIRLYERFRVIDYFGRLIGRWRTMGSLASIMPGCKLHGIVFSTDMKITL